MLYSFHNGDLSGDIILDAEESHHLVGVRRARVGETVMVLNGQGVCAETSLEEASPKRARLQVRAVSTMLRLHAPVWLAQAVPLGKTMDLIVQKAAELGAECVVPLFTERSEMRLDAQRSERKVQKWRSCALEAIKQCGNPFIPRVAEPCSVESLLNMNLPPLRLVCSLEEGTVPLLQALRHRGGSQGVALVIGPEGDFSTSEYAALRQGGFIPVTLGPLVLRAETAAIASMAIVAEALRFAACPLSNNSQEQ